MKKRFLNIFSNNTIPSVNVNLKQLAKVRFHKFYTGELKPVENAPWAGPRVDYELYGRVLEAKREKLLQEQQIS